LPRIVAATRFAYFAAMKSNFARFRGPNLRQSEDFARDGAELILSLSHSRIYQDYEPACRFHCGRWNRGNCRIGASGMKIPFAR